MMNGIWSALCLGAIFYGLAAGKAQALSEGALTACMDAISLVIRLSGGFALWNGLLAILEKSGALKGVCRILSPVLGRLFPSLLKTDTAREAIAMNLSANLLGLGNAATPSGLRAMRLMAREDQKEAGADMCMFLVINASSLQLFPSTVIALRAAAGAMEAASIVLPTLMSTMVSTLAGILACKVLERRKA